MSAKKASFPCSRMAYVFLDEAAHRGRPFVEAEVSMAMHESRGCASPPRTRAASDVGQVAVALQTVAIVVRSRTQSSVHADLTQRSGTNLRRELAVVLLLGAWTARRFMAWFAPLTPPSFRVGVLLCPPILRARAFFQLLGSERSRLHRGRRNRSPSEGLRGVLGRRLFCSMSAGSMAAVRRVALLGTRGVGGQVRRRRRFLGGPRMRAPWRRRHPALPRGPPRQPPPSPSAAILQALPGFRGRPT